MKRLTRFVGACWILSVPLCGCGGPAGPTSPPPATLMPVISVTIGPGPLEGAFVRSTDATSVFRIVTDVMLQETGGIGGRINQVTTTITTRQTRNGFTSTLSFSIGASVSLEIPPLGRATYPHVGEFGISPDVDAVTWRFAISGVDSQGRAFTASSPDILVSLKPAA